MGADQLVGAALLGVALAVFAYYTVWVMVLPFIDPKGDGAALHRFFPPRYYAIAGPTLLLAAFVGLVACFIGLTMLKTAAANRAKQAEQAKQAGAKKKRS